jgi:SAM-dependent methyltransferase
MRVRERLQRLTRRSRRREPDALRNDCGLHDLCASGWFRDATRELFTGFPVGPSDTFLDVGCGNGGATMFAARHGCEVIATDVLPEKVRALERGLAGAGATRFRCVVSNSDPLPVDDASVTRVACSEVMEHVPDPDRFLSELVRVGKPDALYLLTVPDPASEAVQRELAPESYWREPNHVRVFSREGFTATINRAGLTVEARHSVGFFSSMWWALFWCAEATLEDCDRPLLNAWDRTWAELLNHPHGMRVKQALDRAMPKSQIVVARKAA